jgi:hypothetical protein
MPAVTWTHVIFDCPVRDQHYAVGRTEDGRWVFAWGRYPWQRLLPEEAVPEPESGFVFHSRRATALRVLRDTVAAHGDGAWIARQPGAAPARRPGAGH